MNAPRLIKVVHYGFPAASWADRRGRASGELSDAIDEENFRATPPENIASVSGPGERIGIAEDLGAELSADLR